MGGLDDYTVPLMDMFFFAYDKVEEGYVTLDEEDSRRTWTTLYEQLTDARAQMLGENYTRMLVNLNLPEEGEETFAFLQTIHQEAERYYDADNVYLVGNSTSDYDLSVSFARDNVMISVLSVVFVILVLLFTFQSVGLPILLILVIQGSIWINFSFPGVTQQPIFFMSYLIVTSIQMGANIDYAIVISSWYNDLKAQMPPSRGHRPGAGPVLPHGADLGHHPVRGRLPDRPDHHGARHRGHRRVPVPGHADLHVPGHVRPAPDPVAGRQDRGKDPLQPQGSGGQPAAPTAPSMSMAGSGAGSPAWWTPTSTA